MVPAHIPTPLDLLGGPHLKRPEESVCLWFRDNKGVNLKLLLTPYSSVLQPHQYSLI